MQVQNVSFKGYQNVIATNARFINADMSMISVKLNNKNYVNDLDKWEAIQKKLFPNQKPKDIFTFMHIKDHNSDNFQLYLNDKVLALAKNFFCVSREEENPMIKAFMLLKSITERILNGEKSEWYREEIRKEMIPHCAEILKKIVEREVAAEMLAHAVYPNVEKNKATAKVLYTSMEDYLDGYIEYLDSTSM